MSLHPRRGGASVIVDAPAKVNLFLEILRRRTDGYHDLETLMTTVSLFDTVRLEEARGRTALRIEHPRGWSGPRLPAGGTNTVIRAIRSVARIHKIRGGVRVGLTKRIPAGTGLGGGSGDAAAAIAGMNALFRLGMTAAEMAEIGASVGSDVPFFFHGPAAVCSGRGEIVESTPVSAAALPAMWMALCVPPVRNATAEIYRNLRENDLTTRRRRVKITSNNLFRGRVEKLGGSLFNRLEAAAFRVNPGLTGVKAAMRRIFPLGASMTGSGSAFLGLCDGKAEAERGARRIVAEGIGEGIVVHTLEC